MKKPIPSLPALAAPWRFWGAILVLAVMTTLAVFSYMRIDAPKVQTGAPAVRGTGDERDHVLGEAAADVRVILYSDTECPFCNSFHDYSLPKILEEYGSRVAVVYRHYPIVTLHPNARIEADATECAYEQKGHQGFWSLLDALYSAIDKENTFDIAQIPRLAQEVGLDWARLEKCMDSGQGDVWVKKNMDQATTVGVYKTPTVYVENVKTGKSVLIAGAGFTATKAAIETMLKPAVSQ